MSRERWFGMHNHSHYSVVDGMTPPSELVSVAAQMGYPAFGISDHGNMAGAGIVYQECKKQGILPYIGVEAYLLDPRADLDTPKADRYHVGLYARTEEGYKGLVKAVSLSHTRPRFARFPRLTLDDLAALAEDYGDGIILTTGCYFGWPQQMLAKGGNPKDAVATYAAMFPHTYVEVQHHNIDHSKTAEPSNFTDDLMVEAMLEIADELGLPAIATQDAHYTYESQKPAHAMMKRMVYGGGEDEFPGDSFHLADEAFVGAHYYDDQWDRVMEGNQALLDQNELTIPPLDKFAVHVPRVVKNPNHHLRRLCNQALDRIVPKGHRRRGTYDKRLAYELGVIRQLGMPNYFVKWYNLVEKARSQAICIEARGSANGSLVCYLLGVTQVDPIVENTMFERFLSADRIKPPDIDMDVEHEYRAWFIEELSREFGAVQIGSWGKLGARDEDDRGSVLVSYLSHLRRKTEADTVAMAARHNEKIEAEGKGTKVTKGEALELAKEAYRSHYGHIKTLSDVRTVSVEDYKQLRELARMDSVYRSYGVHAAGVLLGSHEVPIRDYIPTMLVASSDTVVTQFDGENVEVWGNLKDDILGQHTLTIMRYCQQLIGRDDPTDFTWIPKDDNKACALLREGRTDTGIFHFEGYTKAKGGKELGVRNTRDAVLVQALYMPGCMDVAEGHTVSQKDLYIQRRRDSMARSRVKYLGPMFESALKGTYGAVVFQEQVIEIMRGLGMSIAGINTFFKVVKDSGKGAIGRNQDRLDAVREEFDVLCEDAGIDADEAWRMTAAFVAYGFNKAHATGYGIRSYRCAYLKAHYPLEFMTAVLTINAGNKKEAVYVREARHIDIRIAPADVNTSGASWTLDKRRGAIRRGLVSIPGVGMKAAEDIAANAPYASITDLIARTNGRTVTGGKSYNGAPESLTGVLRALYTNGALNSL